MNSIPYYIRPWSHQATAISRAKDLNAFALFFEMGTGKTATAINIIREKNAAAHKTLKTLILCPLIVVENWRREFLTHGPELQNQVVALNGKSSKAKIRQLQKALLANKNIFILNLDSVNFDIWKEITKHRFDALILDESHRCKDPKTKRTKAVIKFADRTGVKLILTGTPVLNSLLDLWGQIRILSRSILPENFYVFQASYFRDKNAGMSREKYFPDWQPLPNSMARIKELLAPVTMRVKKCDVLDLPDLVRKTVYVDLTAEQEKHYRALENDFVSYLENSAVVADLAITKILRLQQVSAGILKDDKGVEHSVASAKLEALKDLLPQITGEHKVIVWTNFRPTYKAIGGLCELLNLPYALIVGDQSATERQAAVDAFNTDPKIRVCIANQSAGGIGIGLQAASYMIYYSKNYNLEHDLQSESRNHRGGSEIHAKITRIDIVAKDTIDEEVTAALRDKKAIGELLLDIKQARNVKCLDAA